MPELPEVEITRRGLAASLQGARISAITVRQPKLRYPVPADLAARLVGQSLLSIGRRAKYLLLETDAGTLIIHLGMSGSLRVLAANTPVAKHDHVDIHFDQRILRYTDPRRFGAILFTTQSAQDYALTSHLGIEPLSDAFTGTALKQLVRGRKTPIKLLLMDAKHIVGVGNIYASESLFRAAIHPATPAGRLSLARCEKLVGCVRDTLNAALAAGGSTLRDFVNSEGQTGYFQQKYFVYGRTGEACKLCGTAVQRVVMGQRSTFFCAKCQLR